MPFTVYDAANAYTKEIKSGLAINAKTLILHNEDHFRYALRGGATYVRSADAGGAGTYNKAKGFTQKYGTGTGITWEPYEPQHDRAKVIPVDKADELASYKEGMPSSIAAMAENFSVNYLAPEFDAANIATLFNKIPEANIITTGTAGFELDSDNICRTLIRLKAKMYNAGSSGPAAIFIEADETEPTLQEGMLIKPGALAFVDRLREVRVETGFEEIIGMEAPLTVTTEIVKWGKDYIVPVPKDRMNSVIAMLDGEDDAGHYEIGGVGSGNRVIRMLAIPLAAAFTSIRYVVNNLLLPGDMRGFDISESEVTKSMRVLRDGVDANGMFSNLTINNVAFNPYYDRFEFHSRIIYGADIFKSRRKVCFAIADEAI